MKHHLRNVAAIAAVFGMVPHAVAEDTWSLTGDVYELAVTSGPCVDESSAHVAALQRCAQLMIPVVTGQVPDDISKSDRRWIQDQLRESWSSLAKKVQRRDRAYGTLCEVTLCGQLTQDAVQEIHMKWSERMRHHRICISVTVLGLATLLVTGPVLFLYFDRLTNGDRRSLLTGGLITSSAACGFMCLLHWVG